MKQKKLLKNELPRYRDRLRQTFEEDSMVYKFWKFLAQLNKKPDLKNKGSGEGGNHEKEIY